MPIFYRKGSGGSEPQGPSVPWPWGQPRLPHRSSLSLKMPSSSTPTQLIRGEPVASDHGTHLHWHILHAPLMLCSSLCSAAPYQSHLLSLHHSSSPECRNEENPCLLLSHCITVTPELIGYVFMLMAILLYTKHKSQFHGDSGIWTSGKKIPLLYFQKSVTEKSQ